LVSLIRGTKAGAAKMMEDDADLHALLGRLTGFPTPVQGGVWVREPAVPRPGVSQLPVECHQCGPDDRGVMPAVTLLPVHLADPAGRSFEAVFVGQCSRCRTVRYAFPRRSEGGAP
jgi:hypothetical protein